MLTQDEAEAIGGNFETAHAAMLADMQQKINTATGVDKLPLLKMFREEFIGLRQNHWEAILAASDGEFAAPHQLSELNPAHAIALAVRNDIADSEDMCDRLARGNTLALQITDLKKSAPVGVGGALKVLAKEAGLPTDGKGKDGKDDPFDKIIKILSYVGLGLVGIFSAGLFLRARGK